MIDAKYRDILARGLRKTLPDVGLRAGMVHPSRRRAGRGHLSQWQQAGRAWLTVHPPQGGVRHIELRTVDWSAALSAIRSRDRRGTADGEVQVRWRLRQPEPPIGL